MRIAVWAIICLLLLGFAPPLVAAGPGHAAPHAESNNGNPPETWQQASPPVAAGTGELISITFNVAGQAVNVKSGGVLALHPDSPFCVLDMQTGSWFDFGLHAELAGMPGVDLKEKTYTLVFLLGEQIYQREYVDVLVMRKDTVLGGVRVNLRLLPIDWLRRAEQATDPDEKAFCLFKAYQLSPDDKLLALSLVDGLRRLGRLDQALKVLDDYPGLNQDAAALKQQGHIYYSLGRLDEALLSFQAALALKNDDLESLLALVDIYEGKVNWPAAALLLKEIIASHRPSEEDGFDDDTDDSDVLPKRQVDPELAQIWLRLARALSHMPEAIGESLAAYEKYVRIAEADHLLWLEIAQLRQRAGDTQGALAARTQALRLQPDNVDMVMQLQKALQADDKLAQAAAVLTQGLQKLPGEDVLWQELISLYRKMGDHEALLKAYGDYLVLRPKQAELHYGLALALEEGKQYPEAAAAMAAALALAPGNADYLLGLLRLKSRLGNWDEALTLAERLLAEHSQSLALWQELYTHLGGKRPAELARLLDRALDVPRPLPKLYEMRAVLALNQHKGDEAALVLEKAAVALPSDLRICYLLAGIYEGLNQDVKALPLYEKIIHSNPDYEDAGKRYLQLRIRLLEKN